MSRQLFRIIDAAQIPDLSQTCPADVDPEAVRQRLDAATTEERIQLRQAAIEAGREDGYRTGYTAGLTAGQTDLAAWINEIKSQSNELDAELARLAPTVVAHVMELGIRLAEAITGSPTLFDRAGALTALLADVRDQAPPRTRIWFRIHPETLSLLDRNLWADIDIVPDPSLRQGGAVFEVTAVDTNQIISRLDATIERRLETLDSLRASSIVDPSSL